MTLSISRKGLILVAVPLLFQVAFVAAVIAFQQAQAEAEFWADHSKDVIAAANEIRAAVADVEASARGRVIAKLPSFEDDFRAAVDALPARLDALAGLVADNPGQAARAEAVRRAAEDVVGWQGGLVTLIADGNTATAAGRVGSGRGEQLGRTFRREFDGFVAEERRLDRDRSDTLERSRSRLGLLVGIGGAVLVTGMTVLGMAFQRGIARRFAALEATARALADGKPLAEPLAGTDEIARLDRAFRDMAAEVTRTSEAFRDLYDHAPCGYHSVDPAGTLLAVNRTEARWLGYRIDELAGRVRFADLVAPGSREAYLRGFAAVRDTGAVTDVELELVRKDGTTFPVLVSSSSVRDAGGRYLRSRTTLTDLTERKRAEAATRLFADVTRNIPIGLLIYQLDAAGDPPVLRFRSGNAGAARLLGIPMDESAGRPVVEVFPAIPADRLSRYAVVAATGGVDDLGEFRYGDDRVAERWWAVQAFGLPERAVGIAFQDVTERRQAQDEARRLNGQLAARLAELARSEEALRASEEQFRLLVDGVQDYAILLLDPSGRVASWNAGARRIKGYEAQEVLGRHFSLFYPPDAVAGGWPERELEAAVKDGRFEDEGWRVRKDGSRFWANVVVTAIRDEAGALRGFGKVTRDVTERKRAQDEVRRLNEELEGRVRARTSDLETANRELAQKNTENEMFVYSVSHDLRSPLVNLQGFSKELEKAARQLSGILAEGGVPPDVGERCRGLLDGKVAKSVGFIQTAVLRLSGIIDALLRLSRAGRVEYRWEAIDAARLVRQVVDSIQATVAEKGATVRVGDLPPAWGDRTAVEQVFGNLIGNALTYLDPSRPGAVEVGSVPADGPGGHTYFVRDNGLGIADGHRAKIFQAFQRAHPGVGSGEGLGLAIVSRVVERHRGRVWVESAPGVGSTFFVALPAPPGEAGR